MKTSIKSGFLLGLIVAAVGGGALFAPAHSVRADDDSGAITEQDVGKGIFDARCSTCHGENGDGNVGKIMPLTAPPLKGDQFVISAPDKMIADVIRHGRTGARRHFDDTYPDMPSFDASMIEDIRPLLAYLKGDMQKGN
ncbi:MAG TPA: c-type cytochrome [Gammaproteobacteria bacterium]